MKRFIHDDFLLQSKAARKLYHDYAAYEPIVDFHNHLPPDEIQANKSYKNLTEVWLKGDHYKWRAMRASGVPEEVITGKASDKEKFMAWAKTVPQTLKNPLYHWTHLELKRYFDVDALLNEDTAEEIWNHANDCLGRPEYSARGLLENKNVHVVCSTDDAADSLEYHRAYMAETWNKGDKTHSPEAAPDSRKRQPFVLYPTFRPDQAMKIEDLEVFKAYLIRLEGASGISISGYPSFLEALRQRHDYFDQMGCRASDHGIEEPYAEDYTEQEVASIFSKALSGKQVDSLEVLKFKSALMHEFALMDYQRGWAFQMHIGAIRNNNTRGFQTLGADKGYDSIGDFQIARPLARFLDRLEVNNQLPRTIIYNLNSSDNALISTMIGNFMGDGTAGKIQHGPAWWFHDQKEGMEEHLQILSNMGLISRFVGMVTDSRSFLSFPRHEYYRRVLCNMLGSDMESGIVPSDYTMIGSLVKQLCYDNAVEYFNYRVLPSRK